MICDDFSRNDRAGRKNVLDGGWHAFATKRAVCPGHPMSKSSLLREAKEESGFDVERIGDRLRTTGPRTRALIAPR